MSRIPRIRLFGIVSFSVWLIIGQKMEATTGEGYFTEGALNNSLGQKTKIDLADVVPILEKAIAAWGAKEAENGKKAAP